VNVKQICLLVAGLMIIETLYAFDKVSERHCQLWKSSDRWQKL